jgi:predicted DNA-binding helix-hairpin-helix protein
MIIGASAETDRQIISLTGALYRKFELKRVYYSAYVPINQDLPLPVPLSAQPVVPPLLREHRLYQADWLMRFYQFDAEEILENTAPFLDNHLDPKAAWAARHPEFFPLEVNRAAYQELLRVPGIGVNGALRIIRARRTASLDFPHLKRMGIVLKRARHFILCRGRSYQHIEVGGAFLRERLLREAGFDPARQLELFEPRGLPDAP